mmetsp:Transcript_39421/g.80858  ORF Transcript_39421/g.80858 Transcript_39421/m.80858 type:complete len:395 (+) Transcript_39421:1641-2825(+)
MNSIQDAGGTPFSVLMNQAFRLKNAQLASSRSTFDSYPTFYQNSLFPQPEIVALRSSSSFEERLEGASKIKEEGNAAYYNNEYGDAVQKYEMAISVFRYLQNTNLDWKSKGIRDEDITEIDNLGENDREKAQVSSFLLSCYGNLALVLLKCRQYRTAIDACNESLRIDPQCVKALYLRSRSLFEPPSAGAVEEEAALSDLIEANKIDPSNKAVRTTLRDLRESIRRQKAQDKIAFGGMFDRGTIYHDRKDGPGGGAAGNKNMTVAQAKSLVDALSARGMETEAGGVRRVIEETTSSHSTTVDFRKPTPQMIKEADSYGVDLSDERVVAMLEDMQRPKSAEGPNAAANQCGNTACSLSAVLSRIRRYTHLLHVGPREVGLGLIAYLAVQFIRHWK